MSFFSTPDLDESSVEIDGVWFEGLDAFMPRRYFGLFCIVHRETPVTFFRSPDAAAGFIDLMFTVPNGAKLSLAKLEEKAIERGRELAEDPKTFSWWMERFGGRR